MSGVPDVRRTARIRTAMGFDVLVHRLPDHPRALVLDFMSHQERPEVLVPVTGGPNVEDPREVKPTAAERFAILFAPDQPKPDRRCWARDTGGVRERERERKRRRMRKGRKRRKSAPTDDWLD